MRLIDVYSSEEFLRVLYDLLLERKPWQSISHKSTPTWDDHVRFVDSRPYEAWYLIEVDHLVVGSVYLTKKREVGIFIFEKHAGHHYAEEAIKLLMDKHPGNLIANVAPYNGPSHALFQKLGGKVIQHTYLVGQTA